MNLNERQNKIISMLKETQSIQVKDLADRLFVSEATIRRDLTEMNRLGLLERSHGGAILSENAEEISIFIRMSKNAQEKEHAVTNALPHLPPFQSVFIDSSSTALALAERMDLSHKTVVTNNLQAAIQLSKKRDVHLIVLGGSVRYNTVSATGSLAARQLYEFSFDLMICSCAAVQNGEALERSLEQKEIKSVAFSRSRFRLLVFDNSKYQEHGAHKIAGLSDFDLVVTNEPPADPLSVKDTNLIY